MITNDWLPGDGYRKVNVGPRALGTPRASRAQRERERERERRDATAVRWAGAGEAEGAVTGPLGLSLPSQGQTRDQTREGEGDNLQICP